MNLTEKQKQILGRLYHGHSVLFENIENQEAACQLDTLGLCAAYTDSGYSLGVIWARITPAGRAHLESHDDRHA